MAFNVPILPKISEERKKNPLDVVLLSVSSPGASNLSQTKKPN